MGAVLTAVAALDAAVVAQSSSSVGQILVDYGSFTASRSEIDFAHGVTAQQGDLYSLTADSLTFILPKTKPTAAKPIERGIALGSKDQQVDVQMSDVEGGNSYDVRSDKAVLTPDPTRPRGWTIVMTGHVTAHIKTAALAEPSLSNVEKLTILLGNAPEYPKLEAENGHTTIVPAQ